MLLSDMEIKKLQESSPPLIQDAPDFSMQVQSNGFDLTVKEVSSFEGNGTIDFSNHERAIPETKVLVFKNDFVFLERGAYKIKSNEIVHLPNDLVALAQSRSSLLRMGAFTAHGVWDAGFNGRSEFLLVVENPSGIKVKRNARVAQMIFVKLDEEVGKPYQGVYRDLK